MIERCDKCGHWLGEKHKVEPPFDKHQYIMFECPCGQRIAVNKELMAGKLMFPVEAPVLPVEEME